MKKSLLLFSIIFISTGLFAQRLLSWTPEFPIDNSTLVITVDCAKGNQGLFNFEGGNSANVYVHVGVITSLSTGPTDWKYTKFAWGTADAAAKATPLGNNKYQYSITNIRTFFGVPAAETINKVCILFRNAAGNSSIKQANSDNSDMYVPVYGNTEYAVRINLPPFEPRYIPWIEPLNAVVGGTVNVTGVSSASAALSLKLNGTVFGTAAAAGTINATANISSACNQTIVLEGNNGSGIKKDSFNFYVQPATITAALPAGVQDGINYPSGNTSVTLVLYAPNKNNVVVIGDFSNWQTSCSNQMNRTPDGNRYWITITGLTPATIYKFQYLVDGTIKTTDPYTELVLDPNNDQYIPAATFPNLPAYPTGSTTGLVGTFQTNAPGYTWTSNSYVRPDKKNLVVYELLVRDFLATGNWQTLTDTLNYLKNMGINAIEVMPFNEFEGNSSWGYNPDFFFAPDKAYGTKNALKKFIDEAHARGMAVIMDAVLNHATSLSPMAQLYWNAALNQPAANSPYFNQTATHPFSVFNDFNHESEATKYHVARFIRHWLTEYRLDGFRWDLSKGFTQTVCGNVGCWNSYDAGRVATWQRYHDSSQVVSAGSYDILEHLGNDDEEADLAGRGMLLWGKMTDPYNQNTMGYVSNSDISRSYYKNRAGWTQPHLVSYAESHDEERMMYKNLAFGNTGNPSYNVRSLPVALSRIEAMQAFLLMIPGPKMIWQFGELGYDISIFQCQNGTLPLPYGTDNCKLDPKPILWNYLLEIPRKRLYEVVGSLNRLRAAKPNAFLSAAMTGNLGNDLRKTIIINHTDLGLVVIGNFDIVAQDITVSFPSAGTWYNYLAGGTFSATGSAQTINLQPGEYRVYTNQLITGGVVTTSITDIISPINGLGIQLFPNPAGNNGTLKYTLPATGKTTIVLINALGQFMQTLLSETKPKGQYQLQMGSSLRALPAGSYFIKMEQNGNTHFTRFLKQ
jgi:1,4-alpha-glucan branching enzyme